MTRISRAMNSDDLTHRQSLCDADTLQATGHSAARQPLGVLIVEAMEGAAGDSPHAAARIRDLETALKRRVVKVSRRFGLGVRCNGVASQIVRELVLSQCEHCQGRGHVPLAYDGAAFVLAHPGEDYEADCPVCLGSGRAKRNPHARARAAGLQEYSRELDALWAAMLDLCAEAEAIARGSISRRLKM